MPLYVGNLFSGWYNKKKSMKQNRSTETKKPKTIVKTKTIKVLDNTKPKSPVPKPEPTPGLAKTVTGKKTVRKKDIPKNYEDKLFAKFKRMRL